MDTSVVDTKTLHFFCVPYLILKIFGEFSEMFLLRVSLGGSTVVVAAHFGVKREMGVARVYEAASNVTSQPDSKKCGRCVDGIRGLFFVHEWLPFPSMAVFLMSQHELRHGFIFRSDGIYCKDTNGQDISSCFLCRYFSSEVTDQPNRA